MNHYQDSFVNISKNFTDFNIDDHRSSQYLCSNYIKNKLQNIK